MTTCLAPPETIRNDKNVGVKKDFLTQICRRAEITGRFAKRFSGERPDPLGFEFSLFTEFKRVVRRVLDLRREASHLYKSSTRQSAI